MIFLFLGLLAPLSAQLPNEIRFEHLSVEDGLSQRFVLEVLTDCQGFLWVATEDGLNKYDGYDFKTFSHDPDDPNSLAGNVLRQALISHAGGKHTMWVCTVEGGLSSLDLETETFTNYKHDPDDPASIGNNSVWIVEEIFFDGEPELWVGVVGGLERFNYQSNEFKHYKLGSTITAIYQDGDGIVWVGTSRHGLYRYFRDSDTFASYVNNPADPSSLNWNNVDEVFQDSHGTLWVGTFGGGLERLDSKKDVDIEPIFTHFTHDPHDPSSISGDAIEYLYEDRQGNFWITTSGGGLDLLDRGTGKFTRFSKDSDNPFSIGADIIFSACEDNSGVLWFGHIDGLSKWDAQKSVFSRYDNSVVGLSELGNKWVSCVRESNHENRKILWIGTIGKGLCRLDRSSNEIIWYRNKPIDPSSIAHNTLLNIVLLDDETLLVGTMRGLSKLDINSGKFTTHHYQPDESNAVYDDMINSMARGPTGRVWVGTSNTLLEFDPKTDTFKPLKSLRAYSVHEAATSNHNYLWAGTFRRGLLRIDLESGEEVWYKHDKTDDNSIANDLVDALLPSKLEGRDVLWVGTMKGLDKYDYLTQNFVHYTVEDGLSHDHINSIVEDKNGQLWLTTKLGLSHFDPINEIFKNYWKEDGLPGNGYEFDSGFCSREGEVIIGGSSGLVSFFPDSMKVNTIPPNVVLTDFKVSHKPVAVKTDQNNAGTDSFYLPKSISWLRELHLTHREEIVSFTFSALDFRSPRKNAYAYYLEGFENDWNYVNASQREVTYTNLDPGSYVFRVKASNNDGVWNEDGVALSIFVSPPWWATQFAYLGYFMVLLTILIAVWRSQVNKMRLTHQVEMEHLSAEHYHELDEHKSRFMANISHEFRTPLTLILGPVSNLLTQIRDHEMKADLELIQRQAKRLLELVVQLLDISKLEDDKMILQASQQNVVSLLKGLVLSFSSLAERNEIDLKFESSEENIQVFIERDAMVKICNNLLSNAFKFTRPGNTVRVGVSVNDDSLISEEGEVIIRISDTGIGIPEDHLSKVFDRFHQVDSTETRQWGGTGIGLSLSKELVELHKGSIAVDSNTDVGTVFTIRLPRGTAHLSPHEIVQSTHLSETSEQDEQDSLESMTFENKVDPVETQVGESSPQILIVEDNEDVRNYIRSYLDGTYQCHEAVNGQEGLYKVRKLIPDLVVSDIMMPKMNGLEFCRHMKTDERTSHIPVLMLTAKADMDSKVKGLETGADAYLTKPFEAMELKIRIKNLIDQRQALRERFQREYSLIPSDLDISSMDHQFLQRAVRIISDRLDDPGFKVDSFSQKVHMSRQQLNRKLKGLTGRTAVEFIRLIRLKRAVLLLGNNHASITEIAYKVGFSNPSHFSRSFHQEFGKTPSAFIADQRKDK